MKKIATILVATALVAMTASAAMAASALRISQVYGGGGNSGALYNQDFVEIFNSSGSPVDISNWAVEYASSSATSSWGTTFTGGANYVVFPAGTVIQPCSYMLIGAAFGANTALPALPTPDATLGSNMSGTAGKVGLFNTVNVAVACGSEVGLIDKVSYGTANCAEGGAGTGGLSNSTAALRNLGGMTDTDNNGADFTVGAPAPRNSASPANPTCLATPTLRSTWGSLKSIYR